MFQLALDTSSRTSSICLLRSGDVIAFRRCPTDVPTTRALVCEIRETFSHSGVSMRELELVSVADGPGSFTGLRIGVTVAKTMAYALGCPAIGVNTLQVIAADCVREFRQRKTVDISTIQEWVAVMNAQRGEWFVARFEGPEKTETEVHVQIVRPLDLLDSLGPHSVLAGPPLEGASARSPFEQSTCIVAPGGVGQSRADVLGQLAQTWVSDGDVCKDPFRLVPRYYRLSAAEEKRLGSR